MILIHYLAICGISIFACTLLWGAWLTCLNYEGICSIDDDLQKIKKHIGIKDEEEE